MLLRFMIKQAVEHLKPALEKSAATQSRAGLTLSIDNSVMDRFGKLLRCTWNWYSGRYHKVIHGQDLLGVVLTINQIALPLHLLFCAKQGRYNTNKADALIFMLSRLKAAFAREGIDLTKIPMTMDSWFVSQPLRQRLGCPNRPLALDRFLDSKCQSRLSHAWWRSVFDEKGFIPARQLRPIRVLISI
jgi:hypothetical protein